MAKTLKMNMMKKKTRMRPGIELSTELICFLTSGSLLIERKGRKIRNVLNIFKLDAPPSIGSNPTMLTHTMKKSRQFQASLR